MVHIIPMILGSRKGFKDLLVIVKETHSYIGWIFHDQGYVISIGTRDHVDGVGCVQGRNRRVNLLKDNGFRLTRVVP